MPKAIPHQSSAPLPTGRYRVIHFIALTLKKIKIAVDILRAFSTII